MTETQPNGLQAEVSRILAIDEVGLDTPLGDLGVDSLNLIDIMLACEALYAGAVKPELLSLNPESTLRSLHTQLVGLRGLKAKNAAESPV